MPDLPIPGVTTNWGDDLNAAIESFMPHDFDQTIASADWVRLATLDGVSAIDGATLTLLVAGQGSVGSTGRVTSFVHASQRGVDGHACTVTSIGSSGTTAWTWRIVPLGDFEFEVWAQRPDFDSPVKVWVMSTWNTTIDMSVGTPGSGTTVTPTFFTTA